MIRPVVSIDVLERMEQAVERVRERLLKATAALDRAGIVYAVVGGNAVAAWVATVEVAAVRNTKDVDILIRREDLNTAREAMESAGFVHRRAAGIDMFLDGAGGSARDAVHVVFGGEKVRDEYVEPAPLPSRAVSFPDGIRFLSLEDLLRMKLTSFRRIDQVHVLDMISVGLVDATHADSLPAALGERLWALLEDTEEGR